MDQFKEIADTVMEDLGAKPRTWTRKASANSTKSSDDLNGASGTLKGRPIFPTTLTVKEILGDDFDTVKEVLTKYQRSGKDWETFIHKTGPKTRAMLTRKFAECREHGFFDLHVWDEEIVAEVLIYPKIRGSRGADYSLIDGSWMSRDGLR